MIETAAFPEHRTDWPDPVERINPDGGSPIVLVCEHASRHIPAEYAGLRLDPADLGGHIAWDIGAAEVTRRLAGLLDAPAFLGGYSRLLIDLNRPLDVASSIPERSEAIDVPSNRSVPPAERQRRIDRIFTPFHTAIAAHLDARSAAGRATLLVSIHSFTPVYLGVHRPWHAGVLFGGAKALGERLVRRLEAAGPLVVGTNQPYQISLKDDYAIPVHGDRRGIPAALIELRNDGLADARGIAAWASRLAAILAPEAAAIAS
jgi:predicted N-formylglutamate amidohydrolase